jgi:DNA-binding NarL/FixJ family response regulator
MPIASPPIRCVLVDDHRLLLDLLADAVGSIRGLSVEATGTDVVDGDRLAALDQVDLLIVDRRLETGDGMDLVRAVAARHPAVKCVVVTGSTADFICPPDLLHIVVAVVDKAAPVPFLRDEIIRVTGLDQHADDPAPPPADIRGRLTPRQWDLFVALGDGLTTKELARSLGISPRTVETHRKAIARELGVSGAALVRLAAVHRERGGGSPRPETVQSPADPDA